MAKISAGNAVLAQLIASSVVIEDRIATCAEDEEVHEQRRAGRLVKGQFPGTIHTYHVATAGHFRLQQVTRRQVTLEDSQIDVSIVSDKSLIAVVPKQRSERKKRPHAGARCGVQGVRKNLATEVMQQKTWKCRRPTHTSFAYAQAPDRVGEAKERQPTESPRQTPLAHNAGDSPRQPAGTGRKIDHRI